MMNRCGKHVRDDFYDYLNEYINADLVQSVLVH